MVLRGFKFLNNTKINALVRTLADQLEMATNLIFLNRTPMVNAEDDEIIGKYRGQVIAADIIADDQSAVINESGSFEFTSTQIPNIKHGQRLGQGIINKFARLKRSSPQLFDESSIVDWENNMAETLVMGLRQRVNSLICAMQLDGTSYNRLGVDLSGVTWQMPSDLKVTSANTWDDAALATPVSDIQILATETARDAYGEQYDRVTMSNKAFRYVTQTAEFQSRVKGELRYNFSTNQLNTRDTGAMMSLFSNIIGMEIEVYDATYWVRKNSGAKVRERVLPANKVIFSSTSDDNDRTAMDFANGVVTESVVGTLLGQPGFNGESYGPVSYYTGNPDLNPPDLKAWTVMRGFPRKHRETATAVLTVGSGSLWA